MPSAARARLARYVPDAVYAVPAEPQKDSTDASRPGDRPAMDGHGAGISLKSRPQHTDALAACDSADTPKVIPAIVALPPLYRGFMGSLARPPPVLGRQVTLLSALSGSSASSMPTGGTRLDPPLLPSVQ